MPDTFRSAITVELLNKGVPIDRVSLLLGHSSVKVTEKHYAPFVKERQQQLEMYARMCLGRFCGGCSGYTKQDVLGIEACLCSSELKP
jgi:hypothetical protein